MSPRSPIWFTPLLLLAGAIRADQLALGSADGAPQTTVLVPVDLVKSSPVVGVQFELRFPVSHVSVAPPTLLHASNHVIRAETIAPGRQRVVVFSPLHEEMPADLRIQLVPVLGGASPQGGPSLSLENILFSDVDGNPVPAGVGYSFMENWRRQHFTQPERDNPAIIGDNLDPDLDGVQNVVEALAAGNPRVADNARAGRPFITADGQGRLFLSLRFMRTRDPIALAELEVLAEASTDLLTWSPTGVALAPTGASDAQADEVEAKVEVGTQRIRMLHIGVRRKAAP